MRFCFGLAVVGVLLAVSFAGCTRERSADRSAETEERHALVGQKAPSFSAELLGGGPFDLDMHAGRIVVLDFWATWCGPCVQALPQIAEVARSFGDKGVELYAVNLREDPETVKEFLQSNGIDVTVVMDTDGNVGSLYQAEAIPQTVIIGKDGRVQVVHVGLLPDLKSRLTNELNDLVAGKNLAVAAK